jgi:hypothetical protein
MSTVALGQAIGRRVLLERAVYGAAAIGLAVAPHFDPSGAANVAVIGAAGIAAWRAWRKAGAPDAGLIKTVMRGLPFLSAGVVDAVALFTPGWELDAGLATGWAVAMGLLAPLSRGGGLHRAQQVLREIEAGPGPEPEGPVEPDERDEFTRAVCAMWDRAQIPGQTRLCHVTRHDGGGVDFSALIKAPDGHAVPALDGRTVAAAFGVPVEAVKLAETSHGPGWMEVIVAPEALEQAKQGPQTDADWWARAVARDRGAVPGSTFAGKSEGSRRCRMRPRPSAPRPASCAPPSASVPTTCGCSSPSRATSCWCPSSRSLRCRRSPPPPGS